MTINNTRTTTPRPAASDVTPTSAELKDLVADVKARTADVADEVDRATDRLPEFMDTMRSNASDAARAVQTTPEPTLGIMTAASIGLAAGLLCGLLVIAGERGQLGGSAKLIEYGGMILIGALAVIGALSASEPLTGVRMYMGALGLPF